MTYSLITWGNTYQTTLLPLIILQKKAVRMITFSEYSSHSSPLFQKLKILKVSDLIYLYTALFMYDYYSNRLPLIFDNFFTSINKVHQYQTRLASKISYYLPKARTNYGKFIIRIFGAKVWNSIDFFFFFFFFINAVRLQTTIQYITTLMTTQINNLYNTTIIIHKGPKV